MTTRPPVVLYFTDVMLIVYRVSGQQVSEERRFLLNPEGQASFANWLLDSGIRPIFMPLFIIIDSRLEEYQIDTMPHVRGNNRTELLNHRLHRCYPNLPYTYAQVLGRATHSADHQRVDDQVLLMALSNADTFLPWIRLLLTQKISIQGIYSLPLLSRHIIQPLELPDNILLVHHTEQIAANTPYGLRQSFFRKGQLLVSRLIPLPHFKPGIERLSNDSYPSYISSEIIKTVQYLSAHTLLKDNQVLTVLLFAEAQDLVDVKQYIAEHPRPGLQFRFYPLTGFLQQNGVRQSTSPHFFHFLPVQQIIQGKQSNHYAQASERFYHTHLRLRRNIQIFSLLIFFLTAMISGVVVYQTWHTQQNNHLLKAKTTRLEAEYQQAQDKLGTDIEPRHMRNAVEAADTLRKNQQLPHDSLALIGTELQNFPSLRLRSIKWSVNEVENALEAKGSGNSAFLAKLLATKRQRGELQTSFEQVIELKGQVWPLPSNLPQAQRTLDSFLKRLRHQPNLKLEVLEQPVDPDKLSNAFRGSFNKDKDNKTQAGFKLKLTFNPNTSIAK